MAPITPTPQDAAAEERRRQLEASLRMGVVEVPDSLARDRAEAAARGMTLGAYRAGRTAGLPLPPPRWSELPATSPRTTEFLSNPNNAGVAHDDIVTLQDMESLLAGGETFRAPAAPVDPNRQARILAEYGPNAFSGPMQPAQGDNTISGWLRGIGTAFTQGGVALPIAGLQQQFNDYLVAAGLVEAPATDQYGRTQYEWRTRQAQGQMDLNRPVIENDFARAVYSAGESGAIMVPSVALSILTRNATPGLIALGAQTEGAAYAKYRERGGTVGEATVGAGGEAAVEVLTEMLPMGFLVKNLGKKGAIGFVSGVLAREVPGELAATMAQDAIDTAIANPDATWADYWASRPDALTQTAISTVTLSLVMGGANAAIGTLANRGASAQEQSQRAESGARMVEQLGVLASASKLNAREAQTFQQFVDMAAEDGDVTDIYIATETLFQSANETDLDLDALAAAVPHVAEQIRSGASDIRMTVGEYTAHVAGTQANAALLDHLRTDPLGMSRADAREQLANLDATVQQDFDKAFERSAETEASMASRDAVAAQIASKLNTTGRFTSDVNQRYGMIVANFYATLGARRGMSAEQMAELLPLGFDAELPGTSQDNTFSQEESVDLIHFSGTPGIKASDPSRWGSAGVTPAAERERRDAGAPGRTYFGVQGVYNGEPETGINGRFFRYRARVPASKLYDFDADPQNLKPTEGTSAEIATAYEKAIQAAGFSGYRSDASIPGAVALFDAVDMEQAGPVRTVEDAQRLAARMRELAQKDRLARLAARTDPNESITTRPAEDFRGQALSELFGSSYAQTGVPLLDNPLPIEGKVTINAVAKALTDHHMATEGRKLYPENDEADYARVRDAMSAEVRAQLLQPNSGVGWYSADVQKALEMAGRVYPKLLTEPSHRSLYLTFAGLFSSGLDPDEAFMRASEAYEAYEATGVIQVKRSDTSIARGAEVQMSTFKSNKTGEMVTRPSGWGPRNPDNEKMLANVAYLVEREGSLQAAMDWLITPQSRADINAAMLDSGIYKGARYKTKAEIAGSDKPGYLIFGLKLGPYTMGLQGYDIDAEDVTVDLWYIRTYRRHIGRLFEGPLDPKTGIVGQPSDADGGVDRRMIVRLTEDLSKEFDLPAGDVQAVLWFFEKRLWAAQGIRTNEGTNSSGAAKLLRAKGIDPDDGDGGRVAADRAFPADGGVFNQGPLPRTVDAYFSPENIGSLLEKDDWAILTAANPQGNEVSAEENEKALAELAAELDAMGVDYQPSQGKYQGTGEPGFTIVGITEAQARDLGEAYDQHSVLTPRGLIYQDGRVDEAVGVIVYDTAPTEDFYTEIPGTGVMFALDIPALRGGDTYNQSDPFYSALERAVEQSPLTKAPAAQWMATLSKTPGVKKEEIEITGVNDWLDGLADPDPVAQAFALEAGQVDAKGNVSKETVLAFVRAGGVQLEETVLGETGDVQAKIDARTEEILDEMVQDYVETYEFDNAVYVDEIEADEGGEGGGWALKADGRRIDDEVYESEDAAQEQADEYNQDAERASLRAFRDDNRTTAERQAEGELEDDPNATRFENFSMAASAVPGSYREFLLRMPTFKGEAFQSAEGHFDGYDDVLGFVQLSEHADAEGKRVLFLSAVQSTHHQAGRDTGYAIPADPATLAARQEDYNAALEEQRASWPPLVTTALQTLERHLGRYRGNPGVEEATQRQIDDITDRNNRNPSSAAIYSVNVLNAHRDGPNWSPEAEAVVVEYNRARLATTEASNALKTAQGQGIADAPWKKSWDALLMKRMIRYAVDNGFEKVAWINGNQQNGGQTGGDGSFFYERNLVNTTNDLLKKYGTRVEPVDFRPSDYAAENDADRARYDAELRQSVEGGTPQAEAEAYFASAYEALDDMDRPKSGLGVQNGFVITPELRDAAMSGFAMFQQNRGQIAFGKDISQTPSVISLLKTADLSTFLHETGHFFLEATLHLANMPDADAVSVADANILMRWFAPDMTLEKWAGMTLEEKTPYHERFARGFEAYLFEGKAPSNEMRSLFRTFSSWLKSVYKSLTDLNVELTDDVRGVMDRMLASEAEIEDAQQVWALSALYDQKPEGMTEDEWARLQALGRDATEEAVEQLERRSVRDMKWASGAKSRALRQLQDEAEELRKAIRAEVTAEVMAEPVNRARNFLRRGLGQDGEPVENAGKLDLATLKALYGDEPARPTGPLGQFATPPEGPLWTKLRRGGKYGEVGTDGLHPDIVAGWFGYPSGEALIEDLVNGENAAEKIKGLTDQRMLERHGDLTDPQSIDKAANEAVANEARVKFVAAEEAYAAKAAGKKSLLAEAAKAIADRVVARLTLKNLRPAQYISAQIRASRAARKAAAKGDAVGVATAKRTQLINLHTGRAVAAARKEVEKDLRLFARIVTAKDATLARSRNMDLVNAARAILAKYGVGRVKNDVAGYIKAVQTYDPELFADLASVFGDLVNPERPLNELTYGEYVAVRDAVRQLWQQSRQSKVIEIDGQQRTIESVVGELNAQMDEVQPNADVAAPETTPSKEDRRGHEILGVRAMLRRVESWARGVDIRVQGPFIRYIWNPISEASDRYRRDSAAYLRRLNKLMETMREDMKPRDIAAPELGFVFKSKAVLYHAMLHTGNLSNKTKLLLGYGWGKRTEDGQLDDSRWQAFMDRLHAEGVITERDWAFVQSVWDLLEETKPGAQRAHHIMYGRYFDEITADPVVTPFGTLRGGYVPALTESYFVQDAMLRSGEDGLESNAASQMFPSAGNGFTKGREENYTQPLSLELGLLPAHLDKVVKFTHLGPAVRQAMRLLKNRKLAARLKAFDPTAQTDLLLPWLQRAAKQTVESQGIGNGGKWVDRTARYLRGTVGMQLMFANVINTAQQVVGGPFAAAVRVKPSRLGQALWRFMRNPAEVTTAATDLSTALAVRMDNQIMETRQNINEIIDLDPSVLGSARSWAIRHGYFMQSAVQNVMDPIIWTAAFDQATSEGQSTADAVRFADSVLRETQGSWNPEDVSRLETGSPFVRMFTQFGGWANMLANLNATETQIVARGVGVGKGKGRLFYVYLMGFAAQALVGQAIADLMRGGWDDDEEDGYLDEALNWFFGSQLKLGLSSIPIAGPLANVALGGFTEARFDDRLSVSPVLSVVEGGLLAPASVYDSVVNGEKFNRADVRNVLTLLGLVSGLPLVPLAKPLGYAADVINEDVEPTGPLDVARGAITGAPSPGSKTQ